VSPPPLAMGDSMARSPFPQSSIPSYFQGWCSQGAASPNTPKCAETSKCRGIGQQKALAMREPCENTKPRHYQMAFVARRKHKFVSWKQSFSLLQLLRIYSSSPMAENSGKIRKREFLPLFMSIGTSPSTLTLLVTKIYWQV
jgi:hypothetical protein